MTSNSTVHISFGNAANHITSHLLNLQGLAATRGASASGGNGGGEKSYNESLCDPDVTHDISPIESDVYASATASASGRYMYVPRALIIDGRDSFGTNWGSSGSSGSVSSSSAAAAAQHSASASWNGEVSLFDISNHDAILAGGQTQQQRSVEQSASTVVDPLDNFHRASAVIGLSPQFSRFNADPPTSYNSGSSNNNNSRHVQWDNYDEAEEDKEDDDDYCYGQDRQRLQEERRRQLERQNEEMRGNLSSQMISAFEEAFYGQTPQYSHSSGETGVSASTTAAISTNNSKSLERII